MNYTVIIPFFNGLVGKESSWFCGQRNWEVSRETWVQFQQGAETLWSSWAIVCEPGIIKLGTAYICKICHYIDSCIFCIYSACFELLCWSLCNGLFYAYFMLILCIFWACCANDLHMSCMCLHILNIYSSYLACWSLLSLGIFNACFVHINAYLRQISLYFLIFFPYFLHILWYLYIFIAFLAYKCISMFISVLQVPCKGQL